MCSPQVSRRALIWLSSALKVKLNLDQAISAVGLVAAIALFCLRPRVIRVAIACALLASAVGELVLMAPASTSQLNRDDVWVGALALMFFPQALVTVGGWGALFAGGAALVLPAVRTRFRIQPWILVGACAFVGLVIGFVFCWMWETVPFSSTVLDQEFGKRWRMAGALGGAASGALCGAWRIDSTPPNLPLRPTSGGYVTTE
jgi:hypothetical protein